MEFRILGPLEVAVGGRRVELGGRKQRELIAILLLHANDVVSADKLIDELWGESPPPTAAKTLQAHVSRLRKAINADEARLETRGQGYFLRVEPDQLDARRFQRLLEDGRRALARGEAGSAAETLEEALALWRGPALADFTYESFAQAEISRLEDLRLSALEERNEAELALGRHAELVAELEALVQQHPLRERLRGQLMLALYRSDRQAEALEVYRRGRMAFAEELGLEPSHALQRLERQILEHDPVLAAPARPRAPFALAPLRRRPLLGLVAAGLVLAASVAAGTAIFQLSRGGSEAAPQGRGLAIAGGGLGVLDPSTGELVETIPLGTAPAAVAVGEGSTWVLDADDRTVTRVDPDDRAVRRTFSIGTRPTALVAGAGAVWIGNGFREGGTSFLGSVSRVDRESGLVDETIRLPTAGGEPFQGGGFEQQLMAVSADAVWAVNADQTVYRIDPRTNSVVATIEDLRATSIAAGDGQVWVIDEEGVSEINPRTNEVSRRIEVAAESLTALAIGSGAVWAADPFGGSLWRITLEPEPILRTIPLDFGVGWVAFGEGAVWATNEIADKVYRIDPRTNRARVVSRLAAPTGIAVGDDAVWVTAAGLPSADDALPASTCSNVYYAGPGRPRLLLVSDLPLKAPRAITRSMTEAIRFVLERRGFRAGPYTVGYQSCDDSTAQAGGFDIYRCFSNAKAYARTPRVVGVIGAYNSFCSIFQIPVANQAAGGPLAMISPSNTFTGLTRPYRGMRPGELAERYPSRRRNYVRIAAGDHLAAVALVQAAKELGRQRLFITWDERDPYMEGFAADMRGAAPKLGLEVVGAAGWDRNAQAFGRLARRIARARPQAVLMAGAAPPRVGALLRDLRAVVGSDVALVANDGFAHFAGLVAAAGPAAQGLYVGNYGLPNSELPRAGRRFLREFEAARGGERSPDFSAAYGAQAAEILLDAIARSDGTRKSVTRELFRTRIESGILGEVRFDENGDLVEAPVTIFRIVGKRAVVDRVVTASLAVP